MESVVTIGEKEVGFKATALTPRIYRHRIGRDMIADMNKLRKSYEKMNSLPKDATEEERMDAQLTSIDLEIFENVAWIMARQYNPEIENSPDEWLDSFKIFSIYEIMPEILKLWGMNNQTTSASKKK